MEDNRPTELGENASSDTGGNQSPLDNRNGRPSASARKSTRKTRTPKPKTEKPKTPDILDPGSQPAEPPAPGLSESDIETLLNEFPTPDATPVPQAPSPTDFTSAAIILTLIDGMVQMSLGAKYAMTKDERKMMVEPLDRIMSRFPQAQLAQYSQFVDPLLLLMGVIAWGSRIMRERNAEKQPATKIDKASSAGAKSVAEPIPPQPVNYPPDEIMGVPAGLFNLSEP